MRQRFWQVIAMLLSATTLGASGADRQLLEAAKHDDAVAVRALLTKGVDVNARTGDGATALHWAAYRNNHELAALLVRAGAAVNTSNDLGVTPLWVAATTRSTAAMELLLNAGADPNIVPPTGETPLMIASRTGNVGGVQRLLARGANVNAKEATRGQTALMWAVADRHPDVVRALIEGGADLHARTLTSRRYMLLCCAEYNLDVRSGAAWIEHGGFTPLLFAARQGELESARHLLNAGANVNDRAADGTSALALAALSGQRTLAALLMEHGADLDAADAGFTALHAAVVRRDLTLAKALVARGANLNARLTKATPARRMHSDYAFEKALIGATPFMLAAKEGEAEFMRALAAAGADVTVGLADGSTPLMVAAEGRQGSKNSPSLTIVAGQEVNRRPERHALDAVKVVLELGGQVNAANQAGDTALHIGALKRFGTVIRWLAEHGAKLDATNAEGNTPMAVALRPLAGPRGTLVASQGIIVIDEGPEIAGLLRQLGARD